jgi:hypothetical protein
MTFDWILHGSFVEMWGQISAVVSSGVSAEGVVAIVATHYCNREERVRSLVEG